MTSNQHRRPRLLLSAYACGPERGSEPGVGWRRALEAAKYCDTWVLCEERDVATEAMDRYFSKHGEVPGLTFVKLPRLPLQKLLYRTPGGFYRGYNLWQRQALGKAKELHAEIRFDLIHHLNYCGFREPGYLWKLDAPFIWGPVGGTQNFPAAFLSTCGMRGAMREGLRGLVNRWQLRTSCRAGLAAHKAAVVIAANHSIKHDLDRQFGTNAEVQLETGVADPETSPPLIATSECKELRILWSGTLGHHKALPVLLAGLANLPEHVPYELKVLGRGPQERAWKELAVKLGVNSHCRWLGQQPHEEALKLFAWADLVAFTSLRDTTGTVVLEALAAGKPVVCFDHQGAGEAVDESCGVKIPVSHPGQAEADFAAALEKLHHDKALREQLAAGARVRAERFQWSELGKQMAEVYARVLQQHGFAGDLTPLLAENLEQAPAKHHAPIAAMEA